MTESILKHGSYSSYGSNVGTYEYEYEYCISSANSSISAFLPTSFKASVTSQAKTEKVLGYGINLI